MYSSLGEIYGPLPKWISVNVFLSFFLFFLLVVSSIFFIKIPDSIHGSAHILKKDNTITLLSNAKGRLKYLIENDQNVENNQIIAYIHSSVEISEIESLELSLIHLEKELNNGVPIKLINHSVPEFNYLISDLNKLILEFNSNLELNHSKSRINMLKNQIANNDDLMIVLNERKFNLLSELSLQKELYLVDSTLRIHEVIADIDFIKSKINLLQKQRIIFEIDESIFRLQSLNLSNQSAIDEINLNELINKYKIDGLIMTGINSLRNLIKDWYEKNSIVSSKFGFCSLLKFNESNVNIGDKVAVIVTGEETYFVAVNVPISGSGKVKLGQDVIIKLHNYPSIQYGQLRGKVENISMGVEDGFFLVSVELNNGLYSSNNILLDYNDGLIGIAEIFAENVSLFQKFVSNFD